MCESKKLNYEKSSFVCTAVYRYVSMYYAMDLCARTDFLLAR